MANEISENGVAWRGNGVSISDDSQRIGGANGVSASDAVIAATPLRRIYLLVARTRTSKRKATRPEKIGMRCGWPAAAYGVEKLVIVTWQQQWRNAVCVWQHVAWRSSSVARGISGVSMKMKAKKEMAGGSGGVPATCQALHQRDGNNQRHRRLIENHQKVLAKNDRTLAGVSALTSAKKYVQHRQREKAINVVCTHSHALPGATGRNTPLLLY